MSLKNLSAGVLVFVFALGLMAAEQKDKVSPSKLKSTKASYVRNLKGAGFKPSDLEVISIGQSHIDAAWRWRYGQTRDSKTKITFGMALQNIDTYPSFKFHQSSPQYYEWLDQVDPEMFKKITAAEKAGRWIAVGGMWVEPDCNMPEGESFVRHFLYGQRYFLEKFGHTTDIAWLLDSFGYNWNLPQFAARSGQKYMWTSKLTWNDYNIFPFHLFNWQAPDGSQVLTHICPIVPLPTWFPFSELQAFKGKDYVIDPGGGVGGMQLAAGYKQTRLLLRPGEKFTANYLTPPSVVEAALSKDFMPVIGVFYGLGDGGHGPLPREIDTQLALQELGYAKMGTADELFKAFDKYKDRVPTWNDEMYLEYHQGVMTHQEWIKRANRKAEALLRSAEAVSTAAFLFGDVYQIKTLTEMWKIVLLNQFHDILPGSSIPEVYSDAREQYQQVDDQVGQVINGALSSLASKVDTRTPGSDMTPILVYNPLGWPRSDMVKYAVKSGAYQVFDKDGKELPSQFAKSEEGGEFLYFKPGSIPALGWSTFYLKSGQACSLPGPKLIDDKKAITIENDLIRVNIDRKSGLLTSLFDKRLNREFLKKPSNKILAFTDVPMEYPAWNLSRDWQNQPREVPEVTKVSIDAKGPLFVRVLIEHKSYPTSFKQWITVSNDSPLVNFITYTKIGWKMTLVKIEYNTAVNTEKIAAEIPYGVIERSTHPTIPWDKARTEVPVEKWADLSDKDSGIALLNFGKYGFDLTPDGAGFRMSIVKTSRYPTPAPEAKKVNMVSIVLPNPDTEQGEHWAHTALYPHKGGWAEGKVYKAAYEYNTPYLALVADSHQGALPKEAGLITIESASAIITDIKRAEDDDSVIVRVVESEGKDTQATLRVHPSFKITDAAETNLLELEPKALKFDKQSVSLPVGHFAILTVKLRISAK